MCLTLKIGEKRFWVRWGRRKGERGG
jgi:hypothetical protein